MKVLQGDLVFHSILGKEHAEVNWFQRKQTQRFQIFQPYRRSRELKCHNYKVKGSVHFIPLDFSRGESMASATEALGPVTHTR